MDKEEKIYFLSLIKKHKNSEILGIIISLLYSFVVFLIPYISKYFVDSVTQGHTIDYKIFILTFFIVSILQPIFGYFKDIVFKNISESITYDIRSRLFTNVLHSPVTFFEKTPKGEIISRIMNDGDKLSEFLTNIWMIFIGSLIFLIIGLTEIFLLSPQIFVFIIIGLFIYFAYNLYVNEAFEKLSDKISNINDEICTTVEQNINHIELIKTFSAENKTNNRYLKFLNNSKNTRKKIASLASFYNGISEMIVIATISIVYYLGFNFLSYGAITVGTIIALVAYFQMLVSPIHDIVNSNIEYHKILPVAKRLLEYLTLPCEIDELNPSKIIAKKSPTLMFNNVSFCYENGVNILKDLTFCFKGPGLYGLIGKSGVGKSTVAKLILGFYRPCSGNIDIVLGKDAVSSCQKLRGNISYISQNIELLNASLRENLTFCCDNFISDKKLTEICTQLGLIDKIKKLPNGYDTKVSEKLNLSGGEIQRLAIARALLRDSQINIFDELTSSLDYENFQKVVAIIEKMKKSKMVVVITHKLEMLSGAKQVINLEDKKATYIQL